MYNKAIINDTYIHLPKGAENRVGKQSIICPALVLLIKKNKICKYEKI